MNAHQRRIALRKEERELQIMERNQKEFWAHHSHLLDDDENLEVAFDELIQATHSKK